MKITNIFVAVFFLVSHIITKTFSQDIKQIVTNPNQIPAVIPNCIIQDSYGFIWIGDQEGLLRYDGHTTKRYKNIPFDTTSLSSNYIVDIEEDSISNLWIATHGGGLNYFDQKTEKFTHYLHDPQALASLGSNKLTKIILNENGSLWIGTIGNGFTYISWDSTGAPKFRQFNNQLLSPEVPVYSILDMYKDNHGFLWIASAGFGLQRLEISTGKIKNYTHDPENPNSISDNFVSSICEDDSGSLWIGTGFRFSKSGSGLNRFDLNTEIFTHYRHQPDNPNSLSSDIIYSLMIDRDNGFWIGTSRTGINYIALSELYNNENPKFRKFENGTINSIYEDHLGNVWICPWNFYVYKYDYRQNPFVYFKHKVNNPNSLSHSSAHCLFLDKTYNLWVGHGKNGITVYNLRSKNYRFLKHDPDNSNSISENFVKAICDDNKGNIWIGTANSGIDIYNPKTKKFNHIKANPNDSTALYSNLIQNMLKRTNGDIWIAFNTGELQLYDSERNRFNTYNFDPGREKVETISGLCEDNSGKLWIATKNNGLYGIKINERKISNVDHFTYNVKDTLGLNNKNINDIIPDQKQDTLWLATNGGLNRFDLNSEKFSHITERDGLPTTFVLTLLQDNLGRIWMTTTDGMSRYNPSTGKIINYDKADGLPHTRFGAGTKRNVKTVGDTLFFGGGGVIGFNRKKIIDNPNIPPVMITAFKMNNKYMQLDTAIQFKRKIVLNYQQNYFSFEFSALNYTNPAKNKFKYKMQGFHDDWIPAGIERTASFTNLDPGKYIFIVKGSNNHGVWNEKGTSITIIITPPWWRTTFAYFSYILLLVFGAVYWRITDKKKQRKKTEEKIQKEKEKAKLKETELRAFAAELQAKAAEHQARSMEAQTEIEKEQMRSRIASDLHDEIGSNLSSIALISQTLQKKLNPQPKEKKFLQNINQISKMTAESMRDIIWFINPENDDFSRLIIKMRETANIMLGEIDFSFNSQSKIFSFEPDLNFKRNLFLVYKEILQNIIKHSQASKVEINISESESYCFIEVTDNGIGFNTKIDYNGHGLKNIDNRSNQMGCVLEIKSSPQKGTSIKLSKKIP